MMSPRSKHGRCPLCGREVPLTFHHLIPRKLHRRVFYRKRFRKEELNQGIDICRPCHNGIHDRFDESTLAERFASLTSLLEHPDLQRHFRWVARQKVRVRHS